MVFAIYIGYQLPTVQQNLPCQKKTKKQLMGNKIITPEYIF